MQILTLTSCKLVQLLYAEACHRYVPLLNRHALLIAQARDLEDWGVAG